MRCVRQAVAAAFVFAFSVVSSIPAGVPTGRQGPFRVGEQQLAQLTDRLLAHSVSFRQSFKKAIAGSFLNDTEVGKYTRRFVDEYEELINRLKNRLKTGNPISSDVQEALNRAEHIDSFMNAYELDPQARSDWQSLCKDLDQLAGYYKIKTHWNTPTRLGIPQTVPLESIENRLVGTYKLDQSRNKQVEKMIREALMEMPAGARVRLQITVMRYLRDSKFVAIDREGGKLTFGSSVQPAKIYDIVGRAQTHSSERVATLLFGGHFRINTGNDSDGLYSVTFGATNLGSRLQVIRTALLNQLKRPIVVTSYYTKISDSAVFDFSEEDEPAIPGASRDGLQKKKLR